MSAAEGQHPYWCGLVGCDGTVHEGKTSTIWVQSNEVAVSLYLRHDDASDHGESGLLPQHTRLMMSVVSTAFEERATVGLEGVEAERLAGLLSQYEGILDRERRFGHRGPAAEIQGNPR